MQKKLKRSVLAAGSSPSPLTTSNIQDYSKSWGSRDSSHLTSLATPPRVSLRITHHSLEPLARLRAAIPIASVAHVPDRRSPISIHVSSVVAQPCGPLGRLVREVSHRYPVVDGTRPGVAMVVGHARCALQYAAAVVERADHVPFALPPCHSTAVSQRAGRRSARPFSLSRTPGPPQGGENLPF